MRNREVVICYALLSAVASGACRHRAPAVPQAATLDIVWDSKQFESACAVTGPAMHLSDADIIAALRKVEGEVMRKSPIRLIRRKPQGWERGGEYAADELPHDAFKADVFVVEGEHVTYLSMEISDASWEFCITRPELAGPATIRMVLR